MYQSFKTSKNKLKKIWKTIYDNKDLIENLVPISKINYPQNIIKKQKKFPLDTNPSYYNLYDFTGVTYRGGGNAPSPSSAYIESSANHWYLIYPAFDFRVLATTTPEAVTNTSEWELTSAIGIIKQQVSFDGLNENDIQSFQLLSYLYDESGNEIASDKFAQFYRWIKKSNNYTFSYHAFFIIPENSQISLNADLIFLNKREYNAIQQSKIQD